MDGHFAGTKGETIMKEQQGQGVSERVRYTFLTISGIRFTICSFSTLNLESPEGEGMGCEKNRVSFDDIPDQMIRDDRANAFGGPISFSGCLVFWALRPAALSFWQLPEAVGLGHRVQRFGLLLIPDHF